MNRLTSHPRWSLYRKLRRAVARELGIARKSIGIVGHVTDDDVDAYLRLHMREISRSVNQLFRADLAAREAQLFEKTL
jgi:hypothetical protein